MWRCRDPRHHVHQDNHEGTGMGSGPAKPLTQGPPPSQPSVSPSAEAPFSRASNGNEITQPPPCLHRACGRGALTRQSQLNQENIVLKI